MRLFVAVEISEEARRAASATADGLRTAIGPALKARWVPAENLHLTVRFIGHVDDARAPSVIGALAVPLDVPAFDVELGGCGVFPSSGPPRVLWIGLTRGLPHLAAMHEAFNARLRPFGFEPESRAFNAHLTLARVKDAPKGAAAAVREALRAAAPPVTRVDVSRATIFASHMSPKGPRYEPLAHAELGAPLD
jgi:2'-5' RNA ligase